MTSALAEISDLFNEDVAPADAKPEIQTRLHKHPDSPWRSLGQYLDYSGWADRDRFVYLDRAIKVHNIEQARRNASSKRAGSVVSIDCQSESRSVIEELLRGVA